MKQRRYSMSYTSEQFIKKIKEINPNIVIIGTYTRAVDGVKVKCLKCNKIWEPKAYSLLQGKGCPSCSAKQGAINNKGKTGLKTTEQFVSELRLVDDTIEVLGEYRNGHTNILLKCLRCGNDWEAKPYSVLQGHGCPRCAKSGTSFMEQLILLSFQEKLGCDKVLSRDRKTIGMELDVYIPDLKVAFEPGNWWLHKKSVGRDKEKRELCSEKGIRLITVYYNYPKSMQPLFNNNIYTFTEDLNAANHSIIRKLIVDLFNDIGLDIGNIENKWEKLEQKAYENSKSMTHEEFVERMKKVHPLIEVIGCYQNANRRLLVKCKKCGFEWNAVPINLLSGDGCRKCGNKKAHEKFLKKQETFVNELSVVNPNVKVVGIYNGRHSSVRVKCKICGFEWNPIASSLLRGSSHKGAKTLHKKLQRENTID